MARDILDAMMDYAEKFGDAPTLVGLNEEDHAKAAELLDEAVEYDAPYEDTAEFYLALGLDPPPDDAEI